MVVLCSLKSINLLAKICGCIVLKALEKSKKHDPDRAGSSFKMTVNVMDHKK